MQKIYPCLWYSHQAEEAAMYYTSIFNNSRIHRMSHYGKSASEVSGRDEGSVLTVEFEIENYRMEALNGGSLYHFSPGVSFFVWCKDEQEIKYLWEKLSKRGSVIWELQKYPWAARYGWCVDQFGLSWQLMIGESPYKIAPAFLFMDNIFGKGEEAINFYMKQFKNSKIESMVKDPTNNSVMHSVFMLDDSPFVLMEGVSKKNFHITPAVSFIINCNDQDEVDAYWDSLAKPHGHIMCGWLEDKYGVSWQVVPMILGEFLADSSQKKVEGVMTAMLKMKKLDIGKLTDAYIKS